MSVDFVRASMGSASLSNATKQERQLNYFTSSSIQEDFLTPSYIEQWASRKYETSDYFLNYINSILKEDNFLTFFKYLRFPLPSTKIVRNKIIPDLKRVFWSDNSMFRYDIDSVDTVDFLAELNVDGFNKMLFEALMFNHNAVLITDLSPEKANSPYRELIDISDVVSIDVDKDGINRIAFKANVNGENGYMYIDDKEYAFYTNDFEFVDSQPHDLGRTPAMFISPHKFNSKDYIIRSSIFSYIREELEEYVFLKTIQKMTEPNGAIPIITYLKSSGKKEEQEEPESNDAMSAQKAGVVKGTIPKGEGRMQVGTTIGVPAILKTDGGLDMDAVKNYVNFHYIPVESLNYLNKRVQEIESSIVTTLVGDVVNSNEIAKNPEQIAKSISVLENTLRELAVDMSRVRQESDYIFLALMFGKERINEVSIFYGSDFFLESENTLYDSFIKAPNPIERKNVLLRISHNRYKDNTEQLNRQSILYNLLPYSSDIDFDKAIEKGNVSEPIFDYQTRFNYWIAEFEAFYGDIVTFFNGMETTPAQKYKLINNLIIKLIQKSLSEKDPDSLIKTIE